MKNYLFFEIEATSNEVSIKVDTIFGAEDNNQSGFVISDNDYVESKFDSSIYFRYIDKLWGHVTRQYAKTVTTNLV
jgi:hypothetical protein